MNSDKPKICFVASSPFTVNAFLKAHITALRNTFDVTVIAAVEDKLAALSLPSDVRVVPLDIARQPSPWRDLCTLFSLWFQFAKTDYLAVLSLTPKAGLLTMLASFLARVPNRFHCFTGQVWATKLGIKRMLLKSCDRLIVKLSTRVFADGKAQALYLLEQGVLAERQVEVLGPGPICGVDMLRFKADPIWRDDIRVQYDLPRDAVVGLFLGRLHRDKGILDLVEAYVQLIQQQQCPNFYLLIVGPVDDASVIHSLDNLSAAAQGHLRRVDGVRDPERYFAAADFMILPSYREGFGMVVLEAAAAGLPAVLTSIYGLRDAAVAGETALLVPPHDPARLAEAMLTLATDPLLRQQMGRAAAVRAQKEFSVEIVTSAWCGLFEKLLKQS